MLKACWLWFVILKKYVELTRPKIESRDPIFFTGARARSRVSGNDRLFPRGSEFGPNLEIPAGPAIQLRPRPDQYLLFHMTVATLTVSSKNKSSDSTMNYQKLWWFHHKQQSIVHFYSLWPNATIWNHKSLSALVQHWFQYKYNINFTENASENVPSGMVAILFQSERIRNKNSLTTQKIFIGTHLIFSINPLAPEKLEWNFKYVIFKQILVIDGWGIFCEIVVIWMSLDFTNGKSTLVQVMACCRQTTSHYLSRFWPISVAIWRH